MYSIYAHVMMNKCNQFAQIVSADLSTLLQYSYRNIFYVHATIG